MKLLQNLIRYICWCINIGEVRGWLDDGQQTCASSCWTLSHYGSNQMIVRSLCRFYLLGLMQWVWPWFGVTLAARKQRRKLSSWLHVPQVPLLSCSSEQSASSLKASRNKRLLWLMNYKGLWKQAAKICFNVLPGHGTLVQKPGILASQPRDKRLRLSQAAEKHCDVTLQMGHFRFRPTP